MVEAGALAERAVEALDAAFGRHPGFRAAHAKGVFYQGTFTAAPAAGRLTRAVHLQGDPVAVTARFSNAPGDPGRPDCTRGGRGLAVTFHLPGDARTDIIAISTPRFFARSPEEFVSVIRAGRRDRWRLLRMLALLFRRPRAALILQSGLRMLPLRSYACCRYDALHAYRWVDPEGRGRFVRYRWLPAAGEAFMRVREARREGPDYLQRELRERIAREPLRFELQLQLAGPEDRSDDPSVAWPDERETVTAGLLELREPAADTPDLVFDPTRIVDGIELSEDPILRFRPGAYSISSERRSREADRLVHSRTS